MTDQLDTDAIRARYCGLPNDGVVVDAAAVDRDIAALCDALDDAHVEQVVGAQLFDLTCEREKALRDENDRLRAAMGFARNRLEMIASDSWNGDARDFKRSLVGVFLEFDEIRAALAHKESE